MPPQTRNNSSTSSSKAPEDTQYQTDTQYVTLDAFNAMSEEIQLLKSLLREQTDRVPIEVTPGNIPDNSDAISSSSTVITNNSFHNGMTKSIYDNIPQYSGDSDIQTLLDFVDKVDDYLAIADNMSNMEIPLITMKLTGTASLLWRYHKHMHNASSPHRIQTWVGLRLLLMQSKVTKEHERYILSQLDAIKQKESVQKYNIEFERYTMRLLDLPLTIETHYYLKGLKVEIRQLVESNELNLTDMTTLKNACLRQDLITSLPPSSAKTNTNEGNAALTASTRGQYNRRGGYPRRGTTSRRGGYNVNKHIKYVQNTTESNDSKDNDNQRRNTPKGAYKTNIDKSNFYCYVCSRPGHLTKYCNIVKEAIERQNKDKSKTASTSSV